VPGSRQISPAPSGQPGSGQTSRQSSVIKLNVNSNKGSDIQSSAANPSSGAMSDGDATGGEMSDGGAKKKIKLKFSGKSPGGSRAGSPAPGKTGAVGAGGSRAGSPAIQGQSKFSVGYFEGRFLHLSYIVVGGRPCSVPSFASALWSALEIYSSG